MLCFSATHVDELLHTCSEEALTQREFYAIAKHVDPDEIQELAVLLHGNATDYKSIKNQSPVVRDRVFEVLRMWHDNETSDGRECRQTLVEVFCNIGMSRLAKAISANDYGHVIND